MRCRPQYTMCVPKDGGVKHVKTGEACPENHREECHIPKEYMVNGDKLFEKFKGCGHVIHFLEQKRGNRSKFNAWRVCIGNEAVRYAMMDDEERDKLLKKEAEREMLVIMDKERLRDEFGGLEKIDAPDYDVLVDAGEREVRRLYGNWTIEERTRLTKKEPMNYKMWDMFSPQIATDMEQGRGFDLDEDIPI